MAAIRTATGRPQLVFDVMTCVTRRNFGELAEIRDLLLKLGVRRWRIFNIFPKGRAAGDPELLLADTQFRELMDFIVSTRRAGQIALDYGCEGFLGQYETRARDGFLFCRAGIDIGGILADGSISACPSLRGDYIQGNLAQNSLL